jgi:hypothetical protein
MRSLSFLVCIFALASCAVTNANACMCFDGTSPCKNYMESPVVFVGKVAMVEKSKAATRRLPNGAEIPELPYLVAHFDIERSFNNQK